MTAQTKGSQDLYSHLELLEFVSRQVGKIITVSFKGWDHAESQVWKITTQQTNYYLKAHKQKNKFKQESYAYENWAKQISEQCSQLIAKQENLNSILLTSIEAEPLEQQSLSAKQEQAAYEQAGRMLRTWHDLNYADNDIDLAEAMRQRLKQWTQRAKDIVGKQEISWVKDQTLELINHLKDYQRVPCHRDYSARNWLLDKDGKLWLIDFEHARADFFLVDFERQYNSIWLTRPDIKEAFLAGYGKKINELEWELLKRLSSFTALSTIVWAREHNDKAFEAFGWKQLERLKAKLKL